MDKRNGPLHLQIVRELRSDIESGLYADGQPFPSESTLQSYYGVSRVTVRSALALLQKDGLIERKQGSGTLVRSKVHFKMLRRILDFHHEAELMGCTPGSRIISIKTIPSRFRERIAFDLPPGGEVVELRRIRLLDGVPVALQTSTHPLELLQGVTPAQLQDHSLYSYLRNRKGVVIRDAEQVLEPYSIKPREAALLEIPAGTAVMLAHRTTRDDRGRVLELAENLVRGDYFKYSFQMRMDGVEA